MTMVLEDEVIKKHGKVQNDTFMYNINQLFKNDKQWDLKCINW